MLSMTGYGFAENEWDGLAIQVEIRSVNHRYGEVSVKLPREWLYLEDPLRRLALERLKRGKIDLYINALDRRADSGEAAVDWDRAEAYVRAAREMNVRFSLAEQQLTARDLLALPGVAEPTRRQEGDRDELQRRVLTVAGEALAALLAMRRQEGEHLAADLRQRLETLAELRKRLGPLAEAVPAAARERLQLRLSQWPETASLDPERLAQEVALLADRSDISEELTRLASHFAQAREQFAAAGPVGRRIDFLLQEMHREMNTIGSKSGGAVISAIVVEMKAELEKMREQAQNVE